MESVLPTFCKAELAKCGYLFFRDEFLYLKKEFYQIDMENEPTTRALSSMSDNGKSYAG
ncbi:hypothetical protein GGR21_004090 [Dysgonomonas hofstadii]|uniref:Uncharacterized protein n=1 Tax=Dysgonomonas hofstadii TaxID=637886 RepID=A0A840CT23_9BACT|nr:hypothetical protein [Dysgonomonas hofstadii]